MGDFEALFKGTTRRTVPVKVCLRGDLHARMDDLRQRQAEADRRDAESFTGGEAREFDAPIEALRQEMADAEVTLELTALPPGRPMRLVIEHAPRPDDGVDKLLGFNQETYYPALVRESCAFVTATDGTRAAAGDISVEAWDAMLAGLGDADFNALVNAAMDANGRVTVPFSQPASRISPSTAGDSKQPKRGTSPRDGLKAGSRKSSPSSSTTTPDA